MPSAIQQNERSKKFNNKTYLSETYGNRILNRNYSFHIIVRNKKRMPVFNVVTIYNTYNYSKCYKA